MLTEFKPVQAYNHIERAQSLERQGRLDEAMLEFKRAVEADPSISAAHNSLGQHYMRKGLLTKAADEFHAAVLLSSDYESHFNLGRALAELEQHSEAATAFSRCLAYVPDDPTARYELACVLCAQGQFIEALAQFELLTEQFPQDWELKQAMAECCIGLTDYTRAARILEQALRTLPTGTRSAELWDSLRLARRYLEFPAQHSLSLKDHIYLHQGIACLGSGRDDGLDIPVYEDHAFTYSDLAVTLSRLAGLLVAAGEQPDAVVCAEEAAIPVAVALATRLAAPVVDIDRVGDDNRVLVVFGIDSTPEMLEVALEHVSGRAQSFCLGVARSYFEQILPDIVGVYWQGRCTLPWQRRPGRSAQAAASSILRALSSVAEEDTWPQQIAYYTQRHRLLRFLDLSEDDLDRE